MSYQARIKECLRDIEDIRTTTDPHAVKFLISRFELAMEALVGTVRSNKPGPWNVGHTQDDSTNIYIACAEMGADMGHDIRLYVNGDFYSSEAKRAYAVQLCSLLNSVTNCS